VNLAVTLGPLALRSPLIAASGTVGSVVEFSETIDYSFYGAAVAKSVAPVPWDGRPPPRMASAGSGMLNGIGIQNPGIHAWLHEFGPLLGNVPVPVWGSVVAHDVDGFAQVASAMSDADVEAIEVNLSCPNLDGSIFGLDATLSASIVAAVREATSLPIGAKLSPDAQPISAVAAACAESGADWVVVTNTAMGAGFDPASRRPLLSGIVGGYSGDGLRPISLRCVFEVARDVPEVPIVGCGGVSDANHVVEYLLAGATAVAIGTAHLARPRIARKITQRLHRYGKANGITRIADLVGAYEPW